MTDRLGKGDDDLGTDNFKVIRSLCAIDGSFWSAPGHPTLLVSYLVLTNYKQSSHPSPD